MDLKKSFFYQIKLGKRKSDPHIKIDFDEKKIWIKFKTSYVEGIPLEEIPWGGLGRGAGFKQGIILGKKEWRHIYFVREREGWEERHYFFLAEKLFKEQEINNP